MKSAFSKFHLSENRESVLLLLYESAFHESAFRESAFHESAFRESASLPLAHRLKYRCNFAKCPYGVSRRDERVVNRVQLPAELRLEHLLLVPVAALQRLRGASRSLADM